MVKGFKMEAGWFAGVRLMMLCDAFVCVLFLVLSKTFELDDKLLRL